MGLLDLLFGGGSGGGHDKGQLQKSKMDYFEEALEKAKAGQRFRHLLEKSKRKELLKYRSTGIVTGVEVISNCCPACDEAIGGEKFSVEEALRTNPVPHDGCTNKLKKDVEGWCKCEYAAVTKPL